MEATAALALGVVVFMHAWHNGAEARKTTGRPT